MLSFVIFLPLFGALALLLIGNRDGSRDQLFRTASLAIENLDPELAAIFSSHASL